MKAGANPLLITRISSGLLVFPANPRVASWCTMCRVLVPGSTFARRVFAGVTFGAGWLSGVAATIGYGSAMLDYGRRSVPMGIRRALVARDRGGASRLQPTSGLCQAQHALHWIDGGVTAVDTCCLLRPAHHRQVQRQTTAVIALVTLRSRSAAAPGTMMGCACDDLWLLQSCLGCR